MLHVFVETNWVVDDAAPEHRRTPAARELLARAEKGELKLHLPSICLVEARKVIVKRFQPRNEADAIRGFVRWAAAAGQIAPADRDVVMRTVQLFESKVKGELAALDESLSNLKSSAGIDVFALDEACLNLAIEISFETALDPFDQSVLAAILGRADALRAIDADAEFAFCELDGDLQPWDRDGNRRSDLVSYYDPRGIWVYGDFRMQSPERPPSWPLPKAAPPADKL